MALFSAISIKRFKKISIFLILLAVLFLYFLIYNQFYSSNQEVFNEEYSAGTENYKIQMMKSLAQNSTIFNAITELNSGFNKLSKNKVHSGFTNIIGNIKYENSPSQVQLSDYFRVINKYHPFFDAYAKSLRFNEIMLIEPRNLIVLYSSNLDHTLLSEPKSVLLNKMLYKIISSKTMIPWLISNIPNTEQNIICTPVYHKDKLVGIIASVY